MKEFPIKTYTKQELAAYYFPGSQPHSAVNRLMAWVRLNKQLLDLLTQAGYRKNNKRLSPRQVALIIEYIGAPDGYD